MKTILAVVRLVLGGLRWNNFSEHCPGILKNLELCSLNAEEVCKQLSRTFVAVQIEGGRERGRWEGCEGFLRFVGSCVVCRQVVASKKSRWGSSPFWRSPCWRTPPSSSSSSPLPSGVTGTTSRWASRWRGWQRRRRRRRPETTQKKIDDVQPSSSFWLIIIKQLFNFGNKFITYEYFCFSTFKIGNTQEKSL